NSITFVFRILWRTSLCSNYYSYRFYDTWSYYVFYLANDTRMDFWCWWYCRYNRCNWRFLLWFYIEVVGPIWLTPYILFTILANCIRWLIRGQRPSRTRNTKYILCSVRRPRRD